MGKLGDLISAFRASRSAPDIDHGALMRSFGGMTQGSSDFDPAAHMESLAQAGLVCRPVLEPSDPRLEPVGGMPFDVYVKLVAGSIKDPTDEDGLEARGEALGMAPGTTNSAFGLWGQKVVSDAELGVHYTALLQAEVAAAAPSPSDRSA